MDMSSGAGGLSVIRHHASGPERVEVTFRMIDTYHPDARPFDGAKFRIDRGSTTLRTVPGRNRRGSFA